MSVRWRLGVLAERCGAECRGDADRAVVAVRPLETAGPDDLSFLGNPRYRERATRSRAGALIVADPEPFEGRDLLVHPRPHLALARVLETIHPPRRPAAGIHPRAVVDPGATIGRDVHVGPCAVVEAGATLGDGVVVGSGCAVGEGVTIGEGTRLWPNVTLYPGTRIGDRCVLHAGVVVGSDGFGFATDEGVHHKIPHVGGVVVEDDVELGAGTTIDAGSLSPTRIGRGSKLDDQVMIAHGVRIGAGCLMASQSGVAGSAELGDGVQIGGQSGVAGHLTVAAGTLIAAKSAVLQDVDTAGFVAGIPAVDHRVWKRGQAGVRKLAELRSEVRKLKARLDRLQAGARREEDGPA